MNPRPAQTPRQPGARGVALVMTVSASTHQDRARAHFLSQMGVDIVTVILRKQTANPDQVWASKPGALIIPNSSAGEPIRLAVLQVIDT
jgi:hypothetical protein